MGFGIDICKNPEGLLPFRKPSDSRNVTDRDIKGSPIPNYHFKSLIFLDQHRIFGYKFAKVDIFTSLHLLDCTLVDMATHY